MRALFSEAVSRFPSGSLLITNVLTRDGHADSKTEFSTHCPLPAHHNVPAANLNDISTTCFLQGYCFYGLLDGKT